MTRSAKENLVFCFLKLLTAIACLLPVAIFGMVLVKGLPAFDLDFFTLPSSGFGKEGGVLYQLLGTLLLMAGAITLSLPVALGTVWFQTEVMTSSRLKNGLNTALYSLNGMPTILLGLVGYGIFGMLFDFGVSWLTGVLILAVMILPTVHASLLQAVNAIPENYRDAARALGLTPAREWQSVVLPQSFPGMVSGCLLGLARAGGETAAILFTATTFSGIDWPGALTDPVPTLQTHILILAQEALDPVALSHAWGASLVLLMLTATLIAITWVLRSRVTGEAGR